MSGRATPWTFKPWSCDVDPHPVLWLHEPTPAVTAIITQVGLLGEYLDACPGFHKATIFEAACVHLVYGQDRMVDVSGLAWVH